MSTTRVLTPMLLLLVTFAFGCVEVNEHLVINADGSGSVTITATVPPRVNMYAALMGRNLPGDDAYPPTDEAAARRLFGADDFKVAFHSDYTKDRKKQKLITEARFTDVNRLLASRYARARSLWMAKDGTLTVRSRTGMAQLALLDDPAILAEATRFAPRSMREQLTEEKKDARITFRLTLPAPVKATGAEVEGNTATWTFRRGDHKDVATWAASLRTVMTATCPAAEVTFAPKSPMRLDLLTLAEVRTGKTGDATKVDVAKVLAATKVVPVTYSVTRTFDLAGEGGGGSNAGQLNAVVVIPRRFAPHRWGDVVVNEVRDDRKNNLLPKREDHRFGSFGRSWSPTPKDDDAEAAESAEVCHFVTLQTRIPPRAAKALAVVKGTLDMKYRGAPHVIVLKNAVKKDAIKKKRDDDDVVFPDLMEIPDPAEEKQKPELSHPMLEKTGMKISLAKASRVGQSLRIQLMLEAESATLAEVQVFDAKGAPWPTHRAEGPYHYGRFNGETSQQWTVVGNPEPPLSLALLIHAGGPVVTVPIDLKDLSIVPNEPPQSTPKE